jgi:hypothetical protein
MERIEVWLADHPYELFDRAHPGYNRKLGKKVYASLYRKHKVRKYGEMLYHEGGVDAMMAVFHTLDKCTPLQYDGTWIFYTMIDAWHGIGNWEAPPPD